jgi:hypothetical protein
MAMLNNQMVEQYFVTIFYLDFMVLSLWGLRDYSFLDKATCQSEFQDPF